MAIRNKRVSEVLVKNAKTGKYQWVKVEAKRKAKKVNAQWPMKSFNAGVDPSQVNEANQALAQHGVSGVHYDKDGGAVWSGAGARRAHLKSLGYFDRSGYD